eukprot:850003-Prymnesium_polylepis.1
MIVSWYFHQSASNPRFRGSRAASELCVQNPIRCYRRSWRGYWAHTVRARKFWTRVNTATTY